MTKTIKILTTVILLTGIFTFIIMQEVIAAPAPKNGLYNNLQVLSNLIVGGSSSISGNENVGGTLSVGGDGGVGGNLNVDGNLNVGGTGGEGGTGHFQDLEVELKAYVGEDLNVGGNLDVGQDTIFGDDLMVSGDLNARDVFGDDLDFAGNGMFGGDLHVTGTKSGVVETSTGERKLYALESPTVRFIDEGFGSLIDGSAQIDLDPIFLETIEGPLLVHLTAYGPANLYVDEVSENYFVVKSIDGSDVDFGWYVSAAREGYADVRLEQTGQ